jgi:hypothetical protein
MVNIRREDIEQVVIEKRPGYVLELTKAEAAAMLAVFAKVGGDPEFSPRKHTRAITDKFFKLGLDYGDFAAYDLLESTARGTLKFNNYGSRDDTED